MGVDLSSALVWPTDQLFNINSNINIILEGKWKESGRKVEGKWKESGRKWKESGLCQKHTYRDM